MIIFAVLDYVGSESICADGPNDLANANESGNERQTVDYENDQSLDCKCDDQQVACQSVLQMLQTHKEGKDGIVDDNTCSEDVDAEECNNCNIDGVDDTNYGEDADAEECNSRNIDDVDNVDDANCGEDVDTQECNTCHVDDVDDTSCNEDDNE